MTRNQAIMASLPMLASVLANKYGVSVDVGSKDRACTDGKTIYLPTLPIASTDKFITLVRGYIDHESGHCRFSDYEAVSKARNKVEKFILNALEDYRIEHMMAAMYAGCGYNFRKLMLKVFSGEVVFDFSYPPTDILNWLVLRLRAWDSPELEPRVKAYEREITDNFSSAILQMIFPILREFSDKVTSFTTADCLVYAKRIAGILKNPHKHCPPDTSNPPAKNTTSSAGSSTAENDNNVDNEDEKAEQKDVDSNSDNSQSGTEQSKPFGNGTHTYSSIAQQDTDFKSKQEQQNVKQPYAGDAFSELFDRHTQLPDSFDEAISKALGDEKIECLKLKPNGDTNIPIGIALEAPSGTFTPLDTKTLASVERATAALKIRLSGLIQAKSWAVSALARHGRLNTSALHKIAVCDDKVFLQRADKKKIDTAVHILLDKSGSMSGDISTASAACHAILTAMQALGVNVALTAFPVASYEVQNFNPPVDAICVRPIIKHGEKICRHGYAFDASGCTPTGAALMYVLKAMLPLKEKRKIVFLITDGLPNCLETAKSAVQTAENFGMEVYGIGITTSGIYDFLKQSVVINSVQELPNKLFRLMSKILIK